MKESLIFELIKKEKHRQTRGLELIASENYVSDQVLEVSGSILTNKYAEGYPKKRYYGGCDIVDLIEQEAIDRAKKLFGVEYVNVQPHSGSQANSAVYFALLKPGEKVLGFDLSHGGHLTHGSPVNFSGILYNVIPYGVCKDTQLIDYENLKKIATKEKPKMIIAGASAYSRDIDFKKFREVADEIGAILMADISHPAGLIAKGILSNPVEYCHIITTTTHKTLRGPRGGMIMIGKDFVNPLGIKNTKGELKMMSEVIDFSVFPGNQGGPLEHIIGAKAVTFGEALDDKYTTYVKQVQSNARQMAKSLIERNYNIVSGGTDNHMLLIDLRNKNITGKEAEKALGIADITVNKNMVPFDDKSPFITSGIRIGSAAVTTRGLKEKDMEEIIDYIDESLKSISNELILKDISKKVNSKMSNYPLFL